MRTRNGYSRTVMTAKSNHKSYYKTKAQTREAIKLRFPGLCYLSLLFQANETSSSRPVIMLTAFNLPTRANI